MQKIIIKKSEKIKSLMNKVAQDEGAIKALPNAPFGGMDKFGLFDGKMRVPFNIRLLIPMLRFSRVLANGVVRSYQSIDENPPKPKTNAPKAFLALFEAYAKELGVGAIAYTRLPREFIFQDCAVLFINAIVLSWEMDYDKMAQAPSPATAKMILQTYSDLGVVANQLTDFLRSHGFAAQASHPNGGPVLYTALAERAGMGWHGRHGLIITPEFGPRHRLAAIFTSIENLPFANKNEHSWIPAFCATCGRCIEKCPGKAIYEHPIHNANGTITHIDSDKCFVEFNQNYSCSICVKECMFNLLGYDRIKELARKKGVIS